ncbi:hypothetical protein SAMN04487910_0733 [Aquimarina amphilecti]|uniref:Uncharacterized protein n=1 Tax=Aquimarina amphilecti TaxID=1038014 RepID=A0A1H7HWV9_AQUAM|nr:hypothetical protein SAMN04487910_0733 [Aquimarina amphilecti]
MLKELFLGGSASLFDFHCRFLRVSRVRIYSNFLTVNPLFKK